MASLSDKLKALGVQTGPAKKALKRRGPTIQEIMHGEVITNPFGECYLVTKVYPHGTFHGGVELSLKNPLALLGAWSGMSEIADAPPERFIFLDTETTGLGGGVGTLLFMVGMGRFQPDGFHLHQFFLRDPAEETAMLAAMEGYLDEADHLVTYNGKSFDLPLLRSRYISNGWETPWQPASHVDLLHLARRLWRDRLPSRTLGAVEDQIMGVERSEEEVPGWLVPQLYVEYLQSKDAGPMKGVFYHNAMDILSLAGLLDTAAGILHSAVAGGHEDPIELLAVARLCEDLGKPKQAVAIYSRCLTSAHSTSMLGAARRRLSFLYKRMGNLDGAIQLWKEAASSEELYSFEELAKYYEHTAGDLQKAADWTQRALQILETSEIPLYETQLRTAEFEHRSERLQRKIARRG